MSTLTEVMAVVTGFGVGVLSGLIGIGGGVVLVPIMVIFFGLGQQLAQGTSLAAILPTSLVGAVAQWRQGNLDVRNAALMGGAGAFLAVGGGILALHLESHLLTRVFGAFLLFAAYRLWPRRSSP